MQKPKHYQVARRLPQGSHNRLRLISQGQSLPASMKHIQSKSDNLCNIFRNNGELRIRNLEMEQQKDYNVLGLSQIELYKRSKERKKNDFKGKDHYFSCLSSCIEQKTRVFPKKPAFLTKEEILLKNSPPSLKVKLNKTINRGNISTSSLDRSLFEENLQTSWLSSVQKTDYEAGSSPRDKFSLTKLKEKMTNYKRSWQRYLPNGKDTKKPNLILRKVGSFNKKHISHSKLTKFQKKMFHLSFDENKQLPWNETLRQDQQLNDIKNEEIIDKEGMSIAGKSKQRKEEEWLDKKHNQGFFFSRKTCLQR